MSSSKKPTKHQHYHSESDHSVERPGQIPLETTDLENRGSGTQTPSSPRSSLNSLNHPVTPRNQPIPFIETSFDRLSFPFPLSFDYLSTLNWTQFYLYFPSFIHPLDSLINMPKTATDLPPPGTKDALSFKGNNENHIKELPQWLENIEVVLRNHGINTDADLRKYIGRYADLDTAEEWQSLETYSKGTFKEHKKAILENYPELKDKLTGSLKRLVKLFKEYQDLTEDDDMEVFSLARKLWPLVVKLSGRTMTITI